MPKISKSVKSVQFDFSSVSRMARPAKSASADEQNAHYKVRAALMLDAIYDAIDAHNGNADAIKRAVTTWVAQCVDRSYFNLQAVASASPLCGDVVNQGAVESASMTARRSLRKLGKSESEIDAILGVHNG